MSNNNVKYSPNGLYVAQDGVPEDDCGIYSDSLKDPKKAVYKLGCGHFFHNNCLDEYCNVEAEKANPDTKCPICRTPFNPNECNTFYAFKEKLFDDQSVNDLPEEVKEIYEKQEGGQSKRLRRSSKSKRRSRKNRRTRRARSRKSRK